MIKTLVILVILAWLVTFGLVLALISTLDDLCEYERRFAKSLKYIGDVKKYTSMPTNTIVALRTIEKILIGEDKK